MLAVNPDTDFFSEKAKDETGPSSLEKTIEFMMNNESSGRTGGCWDPRHYHSFSGVSFLLPMHQCAVCQERLSAVSPLFSTAQVVQCLACKLIAHRSCALSKETKWNEMCPVNFKKQNFMTAPKKDDLSITKREETVKNEGNFTTSTACSDAAGCHLVSNPSLNQNKTDAPEKDANYKDSIFRCNKRQDMPEPSILSSNDTRIRSVASDPLHEHQKKAHFSRTNFPFLSASSLFEKDSQYKTSVVNSVLHEANSDICGPLMKRSQTWDGTILPNKTKMDHLIDARVETHVTGLTKKVEDQFQWTSDGPPTHWASKHALQDMCLTSQTGQPSNTTEIVDEEHKPIYFSNHPFASVSRMLNENVLVHFRPVVTRIMEKDGPNDGEKGDDCSINEEESSDKLNQLVDLGPSESVAESSSVEIDKLLVEKDAAGNHKLRMGLATVAGGLAGGVAGMVVAGPVGGVLGAKFGQTAGLLGVVLEGTLTIGMMTSGMVAGKSAGQQLQNMLEGERILTLGGRNGSNGTLLLVRPTIKTDPVWEDICKNAKRSHKKRSNTIFMSSDSKSAYRERYEREIDIVNTEENEIPTADKVLLLVSRILNDRESIPGHVYRQLIEKLEERADMRGKLSTMAERMTEMADDKSLELIRARRQDAHAVIKHITATFLDIRPGFAASTSITEFTATAVEALVFGEVYDLVFEEIAAEFEKSESALVEKINAFESQHAACSEGAEDFKRCVSEEAIEALRFLPEAHSAVDKLRYCVMFLEKISEFFSKKSNTNNKKPMGADSLLKLVCQHIIVAKVEGINAQIAFLEEFARDEQLLRGKEGYALVTFQASLHFLNSSTDFDKDIFEQDDD